MVTNKNRSITNCSGPHRNHMILVWFLEIDYGALAVGERPIREERSGMCCCVIEWRKSVSFQKKVSCN